MNKILKIVLIGLSVVIIIAIIVFIILYFNQKLIANFGFGKQSILESAKKTLESKESYQANLIIENEVRKIETSVLSEKDSSIFVKQKINTILPSTIISSTVEGYNNSSQEIISIDGDVYIKDNYDGSYYVPLKDGLEYNAIKVISYFTPLNVIKLFSDYKNVKISIEEKDNNEYFLLSLENLPENFLESLGFIPEASTKFKIQAFLDVKNYEVLDFSIELSNVKEIKKVSGSFTNYDNNENTQISKPLKLSEFGSYTQRESVYIRTEKNGLYDNLWNLWEKKYFGCDHCVNKYWDEDNDGFLNFEEFIFASNPLMKDSNLNSTDDKKELILNKKHPLTGYSILDEYIKSITSLNSFMNSSIVPLSGSEQKINGVYVRDALLLREKKSFYIPGNAKYLNFEYKKYGKDNNNYMTVFIDNKLIYLNDFAGDKNSDGDLILAHIPISEFSGKSSNLMIILNSVGQAGGGFDLNLESVKFGYSDYDYGGY